jgi:hypothetical protein
MTPDEPSLASAAHRVLGTSLHTAGGAFEGALIGALLHVISVGSACLLGRLCDPPRSGDDWQYFGVVALALMALMLLPFTMMLGAGWGMIRALDAREEQLRTEAERIAASPASTQAVSHCGGIANPSDFQFPKYPC